MKKIGLIHSHHIYIYRSYMQLRVDNNMVSSIDNKKENYDPEAHDVNDWFHHSHLYCQLFGFNSDLLSGTGSVKESCTLPSFIVSP